MVVCTTLMPPVEGPWLYHRANRCILFIYKYCDLKQDLSSVVHEISLQNKINTTIGNYSQKFLHTSAITSASHKRAEEKKKDEKNKKNVTSAIFQSYSETVLSLTISGNAK